MTVDDLLGVGETQKKERKDKILEQFNYNLQKGNINANIELMRAAIEEFPNDYTIMSDLQFALYFSNKEEYYDEVIELGEKIINNCTDDDLRYGAIQILCFTYEQHGKEELAKEYARKLPIYAVTQNEVLAGILKGEDLLRLAQNNLTYLVQAIHNNIIAVLRSVENTDDEKLYMYRKIIQFYDLLYDDGDYGFYHCRLMDVYLNIAKIYAKQNNQNMTLDNLSISVKHAIICDTMEDHKLTAPLVNTFVFRKSDTHRNWMGTHCEGLQKMLADSCFDFCREDEPFKELIKELKKHSA